MGDSYGIGRKFVIQPLGIHEKNTDLKININRYQTPEIDYQKEEIIAPVGSIIEKKVIQKIEEDIELDPFLLPNSIALNEVIVSDYSITPERAEMVELHGIPDVVIENRELLEKQKKWTNSLYMWLLFNYPTEIKVKRDPSGFELAYVHGAEWTYVVIDGIPVHESDYNLIQHTPISAVKSVEIIRNTATANKYFSDVFFCAPICPPPGFPAILAIYTYSGKGLFAALAKNKKTTIINDVAPQFAPIREYYVPEYHEHSKIDWGIPDRRMLMYWEPNITTNSSGKAKTTFFNSDLTGKMVIICEGITPDGKVGYTELFYKVKND